MWWRLEHTYEANAVAFPDGRVIPISGQAARGLGDFTGSSPKERMQTAMAWAGEDVRAADLRFVLDRLFRLNGASGNDSQFAGRLDLKRVAAVGHSAGGSDAVPACQLDQRIKACVSEDGGGFPFGAFVNYHNASSPGQPFLFVEAYRAPMRMDPVEWNGFLARMDQQLRGCSGGTHHVVLKSPGMIHGSFSGQPFLMAGNDTNSQKAALHNLHLVEGDNRVPRQVSEGQTHIVARRRCKAFSRNYCDQKRSMSNSGSRIPSSAPTS
jgi:pimeloyl-ACP methyl ester carboxylesterase